MNILTSTLDSPRSLTRTRITSQNILSFIRHFSLSSPHLILLPNNTLLCISVIIFSFLTPLCSDCSSTPGLQNVALPLIATPLYYLADLGSSACLYTDDAMVKLPHPASRIITNRGAASCPTLYKGLWE